MNNSQQNKTIFPYSGSQVSRLARTTTIILPVRGNLFNVQQQMREKSKVKEYYYEELEKLNHAEREMWLGEQCTLFDQEVRQFLNEKELFIDEFHKKLRRVTRRWASWNHRSFGPVASREQVKELLIWERQNQPKFVNCYNSNSETNEFEPLEKFEQYCKTSLKLLQAFRQDIYRPLCDFFSDDEADSLIKEIPKVLEKCVQRWEALLQFSPVNERLFTRQSEKAIHSVLKNRTSDIDPVVRLIPDLYEKKKEALELARKWRLIIKSKERRGTYTLTEQKLELREKMPRCRAFAISHDIVNPHKPFEKLNEELIDIQYKYQEASRQLEESKIKCEKYEQDIELSRQECQRLRCDLKQTDVLKKALEYKVNESQASSAPSLLFENDGVSRDKIWQRELETIKTRYSSQKIKFLNARKQIETLNKQFENSQARCQQLENTVNDAQTKCQNLQEQLEVAKKNIHTQGNMVEALQHQCYTLKQELDQSNIKKGELYDQLSTTLERCKSMETDLSLSKRKCRELEEEAGRSKSREEQLERENTMLKKFLESQNLSSKRRSREENEKENLKYKKSLSSSPRRRPKECEKIIDISNSLSRKNTPPQIEKKDCIFPDINSGHSF